MSEDTPTHRALARALRQLLPSYSGGRLGALTSQPLSLLARHALTTSELLEALNAPAHVLNSEGLTGSVGQGHGSPFDEAEGVRRGEVLRLLEAGRAGEVGESELRSLVDALEALIKDRAQVWRVYGETVLVLFERPAWTGEPGVEGRDPQRRGGAGRGKGEWPLTGSARWPLPVGVVWHGITAFNPYEAVLSPEENARRQRALAAHLAERAVVCWRGEGRSPGGRWREETLMVEGLRRADAVSVGRRFGQRAIFELTRGSLHVVACQSGLLKVSRDLEGRLI